MRDVAIVGAGPVGAALALALAGAGIDVVALDARARGATLRGDRSLALSHGARLIFERLSVWAPLAATPGAVTPIVRVDVSQAGGFGTAMLDAGDVGLPALGYVVSYLALQAALDAALERAGVDVRYGVSVERVDTDPGVRWCGRRATRPRSRRASPSSPTAPARAWRASSARATTTARSR
ncbi:MAG: FAD-dependent monooxygenase [Betaproteobacteria bacterium]|nr:FAD-dependent monooxygenase [Betaproteobacteria bacterium]